MNELKVLLQPPIKDVTVTTLKYQNAKDKEVMEQIVVGTIDFTWVNAELPDERIIIPFPLLGQNANVSQAFGSGLTYSNRYFLLKYFNIATSEADPDKWDTPQGEEEAIDTKKINMQDFLSDDIKPDQAKENKAKMDKIKKEKKIEKIEKPVEKVGNSEDEKDPFQVAEELKQQERDKVVDYSICPVKKSGKKWASMETEWLEKALKITGEGMEKGHVEFINKIIKERGEKDGK